LSNQHDRTGADRDEFRSSFADRGTAETDTLPELREMALAHNVNDETVKAYVRMVCLQSGEAWQKIGADIV
jgi:hypothetical protein